MTFYKNKICCPILTSLVSGSPIIRNGEITGEVMPVFVNDPSRGYGIFIENMLSEAEKLNNFSAHPYWTAPICTDNTKILLW